MLKDKLYLQEGDPSQNSRKANDGMYKVGTKKINTPAWCPDMTPLKMC